MVMRTMPPLTFFSVRVSLAPVHFDMLNTVDTVAGSSECGCLVCLLVSGEKTFCVLKEESSAFLFNMASRFCTKIRW